MKNKHFLLFIFIIVILTRLVSSNLINIYDDAYITYRYSKNLSTGDGLTYNNGEKVLGTTCPLYSILISIIFILNIFDEKLMVFLNAVFDFLIIFYIYIFFDKRKKDTVIFLMLFLMSPIVTRISNGGMEMNFFVFISLLSIYLFYRNHKLTSFLLVSLSCFVRLEGAALLVILLLYEFLSEDKYTRKFKLLLVSCITVCVPLIIIYSYYGAFLPQPLISKAGHMNRNFFATFYNLFVIRKDILLLLFLAIYYIFKQLIFIKNRIYYLLYFWLLFYTSAYLVGRPHIWSWYGYPIYILIMFFASLTISEIIGYFLKPTHFEKSKVLFNNFYLIGIVIPLIFWIFIFTIKKEDVISQNISASVKELVKSENITESNTILASDIGIIGYFSDAYIYDMAALVWKDSKKIGRNLGNMIDTYSPDYIYLTATKHYIKSFNNSLGASNYKPIRYISKKSTKYDRVTLLPKKYPNYWVPEYLVLKKNINN